MISPEKILELAEKDGKITISGLVKQFSVSRQYLSRLMKTLVDMGRLVKFGTTRSVFYVLPKHIAAYRADLPIKYEKSFATKNLEEHIVLNKVEQSLPIFNSLPENIRSIFAYSFSEMLNNAIEHSKSDRVKVSVSVVGRMLSFVIQDAGVGVFRNVMKKKGLKSELEAIQDILKGKTTTMPKSHSGEGIFFTSKAGDLFILDSFTYQLLVNNDIPDVFVNNIKNVKGTRVSFSISLDSENHLREIFNKYTSLTDNEDFGFDKTEIRIKLYTIGGVHVSRSQARRIINGLEKFTSIVFDFDNVPMVGQAFADEIFRVFHQKFPKIKLITENMSEGVKFMIERAKNEAKKKN